MADWVTVDPSLMVLIITANEFQTMLLSTLERMLDRRIQWSLAITMVHYPSPMVLIPTIKALTSPKLPTARLSTTMERMLEQPTHSSTVIVLKDPLIIQPLLKVQLEWPSPNRITMECHQTQHLLIRTMEWGNLLGWGYLKEWECQECQQVCYKVCQQVSRQVCLHGCLKEEAEDDGQKMELIDK